ncbi:MAG: hypothetical protein U9P70_01990 [Patescibacteria group bacterium]|nr:hypothetical protein [Patescibacteria group bacterium]
MKKSRIFPIISFLLLLVAIAISAYFKGIEKEIEAEQHNIQNENSITDTNQEN